MCTTPLVNLVRQQGFVDADAPVCSARYPAVMFQPRVVLVLLLGGIVLQGGGTSSGSVPSSRDPRSFPA